MLRTVSPILLAALLASAAHANPLQNETLVENQAIAKAQAVGAITTFMSSGSQTCDSEGLNCRSVFGADDRMDYLALQKTNEAVMGVQAFSYPDSSGEVASIAVQMATFALACGDTRPHVQAGVAIKLEHCEVAQNGDVQLRFRACTAPSRSLPVSPPQNEVICSTNPASADYYPPPGKVCAKVACDTAPIDSLNGWSSPKTVSWKAALPEEASAADQSNNGLAMVFYPPLDGGIPADFKADSDNQTILKVVASMVNAETSRTAVGLRVAYRRKTAISKAVMEGTEPISNPADYTDQWNTLTKLQGDPRIAQYGQQFAQQGGACIDQITQGIASDGKISVCDPNYDKNGIRPAATTAQVAGEGAECGTTTQCLQKVVNTNTWTETCRADVPLALQECVTETAYDLDSTVCQRQRETDVCREQRQVQTYTCQTSSSVESVKVVTMEHSAQISATLSPHTVSTYRVNLDLGQDPQIYWHSWNYPHKGQILINGQVIHNLHGWLPGDFRDAYRQEYPPCEPTVTESGVEEPCVNYPVALFGWVIQAPSGATTGARGGCDHKYGCFYDVYRYYGLRDFSAVLGTGFGGVYLSASQRLDVSQYFREGNNEIAIVCVNEHDKHSAPCAFYMEGISTKLDVTYAVNDECASYVAASTP